MKKTIFLCTLVAIVAGVAGYFTCLKVNTDSIESAQFKNEVIVTQAKALEHAHQVMWNHNLFDKDGGDTMTDFLEASCKADSLLLSQM